MRIKILLKQILLLVVFSGSFFLVVFFLNFPPKSSIQSSLVLSVDNIRTHLSQEQINVESLMRLKIPSIKVDAPIKYVGLTSDGVMDVPERPNEVVWFNLGPRPGENGSAVIAGHYDWKDNAPAVFNNLNKLRTGDKIYIEDENGATITFIVRKTRIYSKDEVVLDVFSSSDGKAYLNLVTCTGSWSKAEKTYSKRLVVFSERE